MSRCMQCGGPRDEAEVFCSTQCENLMFPPAWRPGGYVNPYRLAPHVDGDVFEALTACACWTNETNDSARAALLTATYLLAGFVALVTLLVLFGLAEAAQRF